MYAPAFVELARGDRLCGVDAALVNPVLQAIDVQGRIMLLVRVHKSALWDEADERRLAALEAGLWLAVAGARFLALVTAR